ncbi:MAG: cell division protein FtsL [Candidatus Delongbacteria bacterium]|nr:cell division protein FtsL [Candidatus Delongbacteria bacterium]
MSYHYRYQPTNRKKLDYTKKLIEPVIFPYKRIMQMLVIILIMLIFQIYNHLKIYQDALQVSRLHHQLYLLEKENNNLYVNIQHLSSLQRISSIARRDLKMVFPSMEQIMIYTHDKTISNRYFARL